jgi:hypothetical protein
MLVVALGMFVFQVQKCKSWGPWCVMVCTSTCLHHHHLQYDWAYRRRFVGVSDQQKAGDVRFGVCGALDTSILRFKSKPLTKREPPSGALVCQPVHNREHSEVPRALNKCW